MQQAQGRQIGLVQRIEHIAQPLRHPGVMQARHLPAEGDHGAEHQVAGGGEEQRRLPGGRRRIGRAGLAWRAATPPSTKRNCQASGLKNHSPPGWELRFHQGAQRYSAPRAPGRRSSSASAAAGSAAARPAARRTTAGVHQVGLEAQQQLVDQRLLRVGEEVVQAHFIDEVAAVHMVVGEHHPMSTASRKMWATYSTHTRRSTRRQATA